MTLKDRYGPWAVIAGGSEGVGSALALQLADAGIDLVLVARKPEPLEAAAAAARARGAQVRTLSLDLSEQDAVARLREVTDDVEVGLLVVNAGANTVGEAFLDADPSAVRRLLDLSITTPLGLVHHYGGLMRERGRGGIVLVGSLAGYLGQARMTVYSGVKAFSRVFAEGLWLELREHGVDVLELVLGVTNTPAMVRAGLDMSLPGLRVADPDEVAREALAHLGDGPVHVVGGNERAVEARSGTDRRTLVEGAHAASQRLLARD